MVGIASKRVVIGDLIKMTVTVIMTVTVRHTHSAKAVWVGEDTDTHVLLPQQPAVNSTLIPYLGRSAFL